MKILFLDFETSGLADFNKRARDPSQPHIAEASAIMTDETGKELDRFYAISKEDGWESSDETRKIHGITHEQSMTDGIDETEIVKTIWAMIKAADLIVAFNSQFDKFIMRIAARRFNIFTDADDAWWKALNVFCTMRPMTSICQLPRAKGGGFKFPKLEEAINHVTKGGSEFKGHGAVGDNEASRQIYFWLKARESK